MQTKKFQRTRENFTCEQCEFFIQGNGYTNHCPRCLWSKHVDVNPGDRQSQCLGMMEPLEITIKNKTHRIVHRCARCGFKKTNKTNQNDNFDAMIQLSPKI